MLGHRVHPLVLGFLLSLPLTLVAVSGPVLLLVRYVHPLPPAQWQLGLKLMLVVGFRSNLFLNTIDAAYFFL